VQNCIIISEIKLKSAEFQLVLSQVVQVFRSGKRESEGISLHIFN
jgi:hypothetical protein